ncbi:CAZyme family GT1 [Paecilomyces variotii]|nr:CAZyme family GT1 [Paecilomyces variotii]
MDPMDSKDGASDEVSRGTSKQPYRHDTEAGDVPSEAENQTYGHVDMDQDGLNTEAEVTENGRVNIRINEHAHGLASLIASALPRKPRPEDPLPPAYIPPSLGVEGEAPPPPLNVVIHVVGSRGDVQPFVALGKVLKNKFGHRVRLATHGTFRGFVEENGLEFFCIGGDPAELMAFMVKNPGLMPGKTALKDGEITRRRQEIATIIKGCWRSCFEAGDGTGIPVSDSKLEGLSFTETAPPFVADAIIANPPSFAHIHCAQKMGIPLHLMFTMPWSSTRAFPHPLANIQSSNCDVSLTNYMTYALVEMMTWQGLGDVINHFRERSLGLEPISVTWAAVMLARLRIPYTYCWSPALIPKPNDWGGHIDVAGFYFLSQASNYTPPEDLANFLSSGPAPIYIGFGSIVVDDPNGLTNTILDAVRKTGQRALVSKGWGGIGAEDFDVPDGVFFIGNCPHDWLFQRVSCVVHHGGAGTTAAGIAFGRPTVIVPFFGDQPFWGSMIARAGAGPDPIPNKALTADKLADAITEALQPSVLGKARELSERMKHERGTDIGATSFHQKLHVDSLRCTLAPSKAATFQLRKTDIRLSAFAVAALLNEGLIDLNDLKLYRAREYDTDPGPSDPVTGGGAAMIGNIGDIMMSIVDIPHEVKRTIKPSRTSSKGGDSPSSSQQVMESSRNLESESEKSSTELRTTRHSALSGEERREPTTSKETGSSSPSRKSQQSTVTDSAEKFNLETAINSTRAAGKILNVGMRAPTIFTMAVARGFHNAPLLYGDDTVREPHRVTGIKSGFKAATKEFGYGFFDGISGLATQPLAGAKKDGAAGALKGFGKGIGGLVLKPAAGIWALTGYTMSGIYKQIQKQFGENVGGYMIASRCAQGAMEYERASAGEREDVIRRWQEVQASLKAKQTRDHYRTKGIVRDLRSKGLFEQSASGKSALSPAAERLGSRSPAASNQSASIPPEYEEAIHESVRQTSKGNPEEDEMIERALRASVLELETAASAGEDEESAYNRAIEASIKEAERVKNEREGPQILLPNAGGTTEATQNSPAYRPELPPRSAVAGSSDDDEDAELQRAIAESKRIHEESQKKAQSEKSEMDIVMDYIKRQSLAEYEYQQQEKARADSNAN